MSPRKLIDAIYRIESIDTLENLQAMTQGMLQRPDCTGELAEELKGQLLAIHDQLQILRNRDSSKETVLNTEITTVPKGGWKRAWLNLNEKQITILALIALAFFLAGAGAVLKSPFLIGAGCGAYACALVENFYRRR